MGFTPLNYNQINVAAGHYNPSMIKAYNNATYLYWERSLFQRACSVLDIKLPDMWSGPVRDFFYYCLYKYGFLVVSEDVRHGVYFQPANLTGYDFYYQPTDAIISNPDLNVTLKIGKDCELIKLTPDYFGVWDCISYYAEKLSCLDNAINMSIVNNKFAFWIAARNKAAGQAIKKMMDKVNRGEPAVVYDMKLNNDPTDKAEPWQFLERKSLKESYLTTDQLRDFQTILNNFDAEIGIPTIPYEKKERMVTEEAESRQLDGVSRSLVWYETLKSSIIPVNARYGLNLDVSMRYGTNMKGGAENGENEPIRAV